MTVEGLIGVAQQTVIAGGCAPLFPFRIRGAALSVEVQQLQRPARDSVKLAWLRHQPAAASPAARPCGNRPEIASQTLRVVGTAAFAFSVNGLREIRDGAEVCEALIMLTTAICFLRVGFGSLPDCCSSIHSRAFARACASCMIGYCPSIRREDCAEPRP